MKEIKVPDKVKIAIQNLSMQKAAAESNLRMYLQGYMDSQELEGNWNLDTTKWVITKMPDAPVKEDK